MVLSILNRWVFRLPLAALLGWTLGLGTAGMWWAFLISDTLGFAVGAAWLQLGRWQKRLVV